MVIDRDAAARLGVNTVAIDNALNNAYAQRQVSTIYTQRNQYKVVLEIDPKLQTDPSLLDHIHVGASNGTPVSYTHLDVYKRQGGSSFGFVRALRPLIVMAGLVLAIRRGTVPVGMAGSSPAMTW